MASTRPITPVKLAAVRGAVSTHGRRPSASGLDGTHSRPDTPLMSDYRIEKVRRGVEITLASGARVEGEIFLQAFARFRAGPEEPLDVLNDGAPFLPLVLASGEVLLVHKVQIAIVSTSLPEADDPVEAGVVGMHVTVSFAHGATLVGSVFPELRSDRPRLVDFLNNSPVSFIQLFDTTHLHLVAVRHIAYARP